jgi:hypothetical protein
MFLRHYLSFDFNFVKGFGILKRPGEIVIQSSVLFFCKRSQVQGSPFRVAFVHKCLQIKTTPFSATLSQHSYLTCNAAGSCGKYRFIINGYDSDYWGRRVKGELPGL